MAGCCVLSMRQLEMTFHIFLRITTKGGPNREICVGSGIGYVSCGQNRVRVGVSHVGWKKSLMFPASFKGQC